MNSEPKKDRLLSAVTATLLILGVLCIGYIIFSQFKNIPGFNKEGNLGCVAKTEALKIEDDHMAGIFDKGSSVQLLFNFYSCNEPKVGHYVAYKFAEQIAPVVRKVAGIPGDKYKMIEDKEKKGRWWLEINGKRISSKGGEYFIESNTIPPLKTYSDYSDLLAPDQYILLSEIPPGLSDSGNLGLVHKKELVGKVKD